MSIPYALDPLGAADDKLPPGYKRLAYLESRNSAYIDTGVYYSTDLDWSITLLYTGLAGVYGTNGSFAGTNPYMTFCVSNRLVSPALALQVGNNFVVVGHEWNYPASVIKMLQSKGIAEIDGTVHEVDFQSPVKITPRMYLFGRSNAGGQMVNPGNFRIYRSTFRKGGELIQDLVPALDPNGRPCLFDLVTKTPYYNSGAGEFIYA